MRPRDDSEEEIEETEDDSKNDCLIESGTQFVDILILAFLLWAVPAAWRWFNPTPLIGKLRKMPDATFVVDVPFGIENCDVQKLGDGNRLVCK